jgi:O-glycosyl hydrolase
LLVTAFENSSGSNTAIVIVNTSSSAVSNQAFSVGTQMGSWAQPWITSASYNLTPQASVAVSSGTVTYTIPATSVVTLYSPPIVLPPSGAHLVPY